MPIILAALVYLGTSTNRGVLDYDEGYYVQPALHMVQSGDWVTPYVNGVRFLEKPPLLYWVTAISFKAFGVHEFALRLPTALAVIALVWIVTLIARCLSNTRAAVIAGTSSALCAGTFLFTRETLHDIWLVLFIALAMYAFVKWYLDDNHSLGPALLFHAAMAGAMMCKSLVGIAFPLGIVVLFFLISRERPKWKTLHILPGSLLFLALVVPWHWMASVRNPDFLNFFFIGEQFLRFLGRREPPVLWSVPLTLFWALIPVWLFPWIAFLPAAFAEHRKSAMRSWSILERLVFSWAVVILGFFSVTGGRLEHYALPALPAIALFIAHALSRSGDNKWILWGFRGLAALGILAAFAGAVIGIWFMTGHGIQPGSSRPADLLSETDFSIMAEMPQVLLMRLLKPAGATVLILAIGFCTALWFEMRRHRTAALSSVAVVMIALCGMIHWSFGICEDLLSSKKFAVAIAQRANPNDRLIVVGDYESANSISFYTQLPVEIYKGVAYALIPGMKYPDSPRMILTAEEFRSAWSSPRRVFVLAPKEHLKELMPGGTVIMELLDRVLIANHKDLQNPQP